jgi:hypothetical protein
LYYHGKQRTTDARKENFCTHTYRFLHSNHSACHLFYAKYKTLVFFMQGPVLPRFEKVTHIKAEDTAAAVPEGHYGVNHER